MERAFHQLIYFIRYRFLLFAGLFPYLLASAIAYNLKREFNLGLWLTGLGGIVLVLIGVEAFNEYFDWIGGTDRVFQLNPKPVTRRTFRLGLFVFALAGVIALYLTWRVGVLVIIIASLGFLCALFYLAPPVKLAYRGLGELTIGFAYGPLMMSGSYYLQTKQLALELLLISIAPALLLFAIAIMNEIPDYYQDKLVGKRNICIRLDRKGVVKLYGGIHLLFYLLLISGLLIHLLPPLCWLALLLGVPLSVISYTQANQTYEEPIRFIPAIRWLLIHYVLTLSILTLSFLMK